MALVVNNIVKMEWDSQNWLATKGKGGKQGMFIFASKDYENENGEMVSVFFTAHTAFLWGDEDGLWTTNELREWCKKNVDGSFPNLYDEYIPVIPYGENDAKDDVLAQYGISEYKEDIENRRLDLIPFGQEKDAD